MSEKDSQEVTALVVETLLRFEEEKLRIQDSKPWHKKPIGIVFMGAFATVIATGIITFFASFQGTQKSLVQVKSEVSNNTKSIEINRQNTINLSDRLNVVDNKVNTTDKEWRDAVNDFYKDNPSYRGLKKDSRN